MWEVVSTFGFVAAVFVCFHALVWLIDFLNDPEQGLERLGSLVAAFRRGLAGQPSGRVENQEQPAGTGSRPPE